MPSPAQGPRETHTSPLVMPEWVGGLPAWALYCGEERRGDGGSGNRTLRPLWQDLTRASLTRKLPSGISLLPKAGLQIAGRFPHPAPSLRQQDSAPRVPHLVPARGLPHPPWIHGLFILPCSSPTDADLGLGILLPSPPPSLCTFLSPFYLLGRGRGEGTGRRDSPCPGARWGQLPWSVPLPLAEGRLNKDRNSRAACFIKGWAKEESEMMKHWSGGGRGREEAETPLFRGLKPLSSVMLRIHAMYSPCPSDQGEGGGDRVG